jgi:hypothetical protein
VIVAVMGLGFAAARAVLRKVVTAPAQRAGDEAGFYAGLGEAGVLVWLRYSEPHPGQVTGYAVGLPGHDGGDGEPFWYGGGRLLPGLALPTLRRHWHRGRSCTAERSRAFRCTVPERSAVYQHAARQARAAAEHIRRCAHGDPAQAADAAGRRRTPWTPRRMRCEIWRCAARRTATTAPPVRGAAGSLRLPARKTSCALLPG